MRARPTAFGPKQTFWLTAPMSAFGGGPDVGKGRRPFLLLTTLSGRAPGPLSAFEGEADNRCRMRLCKLLGH
jgi:hypothetical protein